MKKLTSFLLILCLTLSCTAAFAAGKLTVQQETYVPMPFLDSFAGYVFAEVENTGDKNIEFGSGIYEILNADGDPVESDDVYSCYPEILAPGEFGYVYLYETVDDAEKIEDVSDYTLTLSGKSTKEDVTPRLTAEATYGEVENGWGGTDYAVIITLKNDTDATLYDVAGSYGLYDADGKLLYASAITTYNVGLPAGQTMELKETISSDFVELWDKNGTAPATVKTIGFQN